MSKCKYCKDEEDILAIEPDHYSLINVWIERHSLYLEALTSDCNRFESIEINYCPFCGRELGK